MNCDRCENPEADRAVLADVYRAILCTGCCNHWHVCLAENDELKNAWMAFGRARIWIRQLENGVVSMSESTEALDALLKADQKLWLIADRWVALSTSTPPDRREPHNFDEERG